MFISQTGLPYFYKWAIICEIQILNLIKCRSGICNRCDQRLFIPSRLSFSQRASGTRVYHEKMVMIYLIDSNFYSNNKILKEIHTTASFRQDMYRYIITQLTLPYKARQTFNCFSFNIHPNLNQIESFCPQAMPISPRVLQPHCLRVCCVQEASHPKL